jgi:hypothetical protein
MTEPTGQGVVDAAVTDRPLFTSCLDLLDKSGALAVVIGYDDEVQLGTETRAWHATAMVGTDQYRIEAKSTPEAAVLSLCRKIVNGSRCAHCGQVISVMIHVTDTEHLARREGTCFWHRPLVVSTKFVRGCFNTHAFMASTNAAMADKFDNVAPTMPGVW